jgi:hypothetical protein
LLNALPVTLTPRFGDVVCDAGELLKHAYFPRVVAILLLTVLEARRRHVRRRQAGSGFYAGSRYPRRALNALPRTRILSPSES